MKNCQADRSGEKNFFCAAENFSLRGEKKILFFFHFFFPKWLGYFFITFMDKNTLIPTIFGFL
jgi:hypothetical protein